jgi:hypothetical protein
MPAQNTAMLNACTSFEADVFAGELEVLRLGEVQVA